MFYNFKFNKIKKGLIIILFLTVSAAVAHSAQAAVDVYGGQKSAMDIALGLGSKDPRVIIASVIRTALGFLGIIALSLIIYAGFLWMTSGGDEEKIKKAKQILKNAFIGLIIILSSFAIASFIIHKLWPNAGSDRGGGGSPQTGRGVGILGGCIVETVYPEPGQKDVPRNTAIAITFKEAINPSTICNDGGDGKCDGDLLIPENVRIYKSRAGDGCDLSLCSDNIVNVKVTNTPDNKIFIFIPVEWLGSPSEFIWHTVYFSNGILKQADGKGVFNSCKFDYFQWEFEVNNKIDLEPPVISNVFPVSDNQADESAVVEEAVQATGSIQVNTQPLPYAPAALEQVVANGSPPANVTINEHCAESGILRVAVQPDGVTAKLNKGAVLLGSAVFNNNTAMFENYFSINVPAGVLAGNSWDIEVIAEKKSDTLTAGNIVYKFTADAPEANEIRIGAGLNETAANIAAALNNNIQLSASSVGNIITIKAKTAGASWNNIILAASDPSSLNVVPLSGGLDRRENSIQKDKKDKPRNAIIQINFNEAVNPLTLSGKAENLKDFIKIANAKADAAPEGVACLIDADCLSFKCENNLCAGGNNYLDGEFKVSNQYKTVEFISNIACGVNACGEKIYCMPASSNLKAVLAAAELEACVNCETKSPYNSCRDGHCYNPTETGKYYPLSVLPLNGIADMALNSLDGNRDSGAEGPMSIYNLNLPSVEQGDSFQWSFFISDLLDLTPPKINSTNQKDAAEAERPLEQGAIEAHLANPIIVKFSKLMMSSSLLTGSRIINNGKDDVSHRLINLWSYANDSAGYWIAKTDIDESVPPDNETDRTEIEIRHSLFADSTSYKAQVGSGVSDIYQNCYSPSSGPGCAGAPSCCDGEPNAGSNCP